MPCALCKANKPLLLSHIVPEFFYQEMYDLKHRFLALSSVPSDRVRQFQKGLREALLCDDCEKLFSRLETYASQVFYGKGAPSTRKEGRFLYLGGLDYTKMKLFLMSLLWRFGVTSLEFFKDGRLGKHAESLRKMLLAGDPGDPETYPCFLTAVTWQGKHIGDLIVPPSLARMEGHHIWRFVVAGVVMTFFVSSHLLKLVPLPAFLQKDGSMIVMIREITEIEFLYRFASDIADAQRKRER